ncbi:hypothetical protein CAPTEDRAFT_211604 [Capitella teleta]|uniref:Uncharacterized protein n=1 Tax=Capitella teleta TaxID=283909 RepID=R7VKQ2_CAPTE|nr:hypothetical protein CAPTEDRAFT_211604 [Capitella teleta]|eukprot:ELU16955.1 hypothetical protein CAPTEDRAFT_211604 [Capitella teleta]
MDAEIARLLNSSEEDRQKGLALLDEYYINDDDDLDSDTDYDLMEDGTVLGPTADEEEVAMPPPSAHSAQPHSQTLDQLLDGLVPEPQCVDNLDHLLQAAKDHSVCYDRIQRLSAHYQQNGLCPVESQKRGAHGHKKALSFEDISRVVNFLKTYAEDHALVLPGRVPGFWRDDVVLLPSSHTKTFVYGKYKESIRDDQRMVGKSSFFSLWKQLVPHVLACRPMTDLCWECQQSMQLIYRSGNLSEEEKRICPIYQPNDSKK